MTLNAQQTAAFDAVRKGKNIFLTGIAGAGKSFTVGAVVNWARQRNMRYGVTASTGAAAVLLGGQTLHSFAGIGTGAASTQALIVKVLGRKPVCKKLQKLELLVIDEISQVDAQLFDKISAVFSAVRKNKAAFGGVQMVLAGDFAQLAPVNGDYCFTATSWGALNVTLHDLTHSHRQDKQAFVDLLQRARWGELSAEDVKVLKATGTNEWPGDVRPTRMFSTNHAVDKVNVDEMQRLIPHSTPQTYTADYSQHPHSKVWADSGRIPPSVQMAVGAQVMLTVNLPDLHLVNGSRGVVAALHPTTVEVRFTTGDRLETIPRYKLTNEETRSMSVEFLPLRLAWAISIHKAQGATIDLAAVDLAHTFGDGMAYTAISRVRSLECMQVTGLSAASFKCNEAVRMFYGGSQDVVIKQVSATTCN